MYLLNVKLLVIDSKYSTPQAKDYTKTIVGAIEDITQ